MFGFSLPKLLFTALAIAVIWYGFKWVARMQEDRKLRDRQDAKLNRGKRAGSAPRSASRQDDDDDVEVMVKCAVCGDYVSKGAATNCGRQGCPYPG